MTSEDLYISVFDSLPIKSIHPLHKAILEEACENVIASKELPLDRSDLILAAKMGFIAGTKTLESVLRAGFEKGDQITLNYRDQTFVIRPNDGLIA